MINEPVNNVATISGKTIPKRYGLTKPQGIRGRNSDNTRLHEVLKWEPEGFLMLAFGTMYNWIRERLVKTDRLTSEEHNKPLLEPFLFDNPPLNPKTS